VHRIRGRRNGILKAFVLVAMTVPGVSGLPGTTL